MKKGEWILVFILILLAVFFVLSFSAEAQFENFLPIEQTVQSGDTLWEYAEEYCAEELRKQDWIDQVKKLNRMETGSLYAGDTIFVLVPQSEVGE